jgi:hypothetical protein
MDDDFALSDEMAPSPPSRFGHDPRVLSDDVVDMLLAGADAPPSYEVVAAVLASVRAPATSEELEGEARALAAFRVALCAAAPAPEPPAARRRPRRRRVTVGAMAAFASLSLASATSAAAATGALPNAAQRTAHAVLSAVGLHVPDAPARHRPVSRPGIGAAATGDSTRTPGRVAAVTPPTRSPRLLGGGGALTSVGSIAVHVPTGGATASAPTIQGVASATAVPPTTLGPTPTVGAGHGVGQGNGGGQGNGSGPGNGQSSGNGSGGGQGNANGQSAGAGNGQANGNHQGAGQGVQNGQTPAPSAQGNGQGKASGAAK